HPRRRHPSTIANAPTQPRPHTHHLRHQTGPAKQRSRRMEPHRLRRRHDSAGNRRRTLGPRNPRRRRPHQRNHRHPPRTHTRHRHQHLLLRMRDHTMTTTDTATYRPDISDKTATYDEHGTGSVCGPEYYAGGEWSRRHIFEHTDGTYTVVTEYAAVINADDMNNRDTEDDDDR